MGRSHHSLAPTLVTAFTVGGLRVPGPAILRWV